MNQAALWAILRLALLSMAHLRWTGHVLRMDDSRLLKQVLRAELSAGDSSHLILHWMTIDEHAVYLESKLTYNIIMLMGCL